MRERRGEAAFLKKAPPPDSLPESGWGVTDIFPTSNNTVDKQVFRSTAVLLLIDRIVYKYPRNCIAPHMVFGRGPGGGASGTEAASSGASHTSTHARPMMPGPPWVPTTVPISKFMMGGSCARCAVM